MNKKYASHGDVKRLTASSSEHEEEDRVEEAKGDGEDILVDDRREEEHRGHGCRPVTDATELQSDQRHQINLCGFRLSNGSGSLNGYNDYYHKFSHITRTHTLREHYNPQWGAWPNASVEQNCPVLQRKSVWQPKVVALEVKNHRQYNHDLQ